MSKTSINPGNSSSPSVERLCNTIAKMQRIDNQEEGPGKLGQAVAFDTEGAGENTIRLDKRAVHTSLIPEKIPFKSLDKEKRGLYNTTQLTSKKIFSSKHESLLFYSRPFHLMTTACDLAVPKCITFFTSRVGNSGTLFIKVQKLIRMPKKKYMSPNSLAI